MKLVENEAVFSRFVDDKFQQLDLDKDGQLSLNELRPAVADLGAALGLPAQGSSPDSDHIYSQVLNEFRHGKEDKVSKREFKEVLSDFLIGMAAGLKRDPVVILRIDGQDLREFLSGPTFDVEMASVFSHVRSPHASLRDHILNALRKLGVDQGLPPTSDPWVMSNIVEPALQTISNQQEADQDVLFTQFKKAAENIVHRLKERPVIVAHTDNTFDGSAIRRLLANRFELDKVLNAAIESLPRDRHGKMPKEYLRVALDSMGSSVGLPPYGAIEEMDKVTNNALKMLEVDNGKAVKEEEMRKSVKEILGSIMLQLEGNPISISSDSVVHEHLSSDQKRFGPEPVAAPEHSHAREKKSHVFIFELHSRKESIWSTWIKAYKLRNGNIWNAAFADDDSSHWKTIIRLKDRLLGLKTRDDIIIAMTRPSGIFNTAGVYELLKEPAADETWCNSIWGSHHQPRHSFITWIAIQHRLPTLYRIHQWGNNINPSCKLCSAAEETEQHLWFDCSFIKETFKSTMNWLNISTTFDSLMEWANWLDNTNRKSSSLYKLRSSAFTTFVYYTWQARNKKIYQNNSISAKDCSSLIIQAVKEKTHVNRNSNHS